MGASYQLSPYTLHISRSAPFCLGVGVESGGRQIAYSDEWLQNFASLRGPGIIHYAQCAIDAVAGPQSSNGSRIIQELRHRSTTEASAGSEAAKRILFCTSVVAEAPGIALASVFTGAPFITGAPVAAYVF